MSFDVVIAAQFAFEEPPGLPDTCDGSIACQVADLLPELAALVAFLGLFVGLATVLHLEDAGAAVRTERQQTARERDAFETFVDRVAALDAPAPTSLQAAPAAVRTTGQHDGDVESVRAAYRDTVMSLSDYDEAYGESIEENMAVELGPDVTRAVLEREEFTQPVQRALVAKARTAAQQRETFDDTLAREADALEAAADTYTGALERVDALDDEPLPERAYADIAEAWHCVRHLERECEATLAKRQDQIQDTAVDPPSGGTRTTTATVLPEYLYQSVDVTYPILADGTTVLQTLRRARSRTFTALAAR